MALLSEQLLGNRSIDDISEMVKGKVNEYIAGNDLVVGDLVKFKNDRETEFPATAISGISASSMLYDGQVSLLEATSTYTKVFVKDGLYFRIVKVFLDGSIEVVASSTAIATNYGIGKFERLDDYRFLFVTNYSGSALYYIVISLNTGYTTIATPVVQLLLSSASLAAGTPLSMCLVDTDKVILSYRSTSNDYFYTTGVTVSGTSASCITPVSLANVAVDISMVKVATGVAFAVFSDLSNLGKYVYLTFSGSTLTPGTVTQIASDVSVVSSCSNICVMKNNDTNTRHSIIYRYASGVKIIVAALDGSAKTYSAVATTTLAAGGTVWGLSGNMGMSIIKIASDLFAISTYAGSGTSMALVGIDASAVATIKDYANLGKGVLFNLSHYRYFAATWKGVVNPLTKQIINAFQNGSYYNVLYCTKYTNTTLNKILPPVVIDSTVQPPVNFVDILAGQSDAYGHISLPLSDNRVITISPTGSTSVPYDISQLKNGKWASIASGTFTAGNSITYFTAFTCTSDRVMIYGTGYVFTISVSSSNVITVGTDVAIPTGGGITGTNFIIAEVSDGLFAVTFTDTAIKSFAIVISGTTTTLSTVTSHETAASITNVWMTKASSNTFVISYKVASSYIRTRVGSINDTTVTYGNIQPLVNSAYTTLTSCMMEYATDGVIFISFNDYSNIPIIYKYTTTSAAITSSVVINTVAISASTTQGMEYISSENSLLVFYYDTTAPAAYKFKKIKITPAATTTATATIIISDIKTYYYETLRDAKRTRKRTFYKNGILFFGSSGSNDSRLVGFDCNNNIVKLITMDKGNNPIFNNYMSEFVSLGFTTDNTLFITLKQVDMTGLRIGCPYIPDDIIGVAASTALSGNTVKVKSFNFGNDIGGA